MRIMDYVLRSLGLLQSVFIQSSDVAGRYHVPYMHQHKPGSPLVAPECL